MPGKSDEGRPRHDTYPACFKCCHRARVPDCSTADACIATYAKAASLAQKATKQAIRDWKQNLDRKASVELASKGTLALQNAMELQVHSELERLNECLAKIR